MSEWRDVARATDLVESGVRRLLSDFQDQPVIANTLRTLLRTCKVSDDAAIDVIEARFLATATGVHLDFLGALVGEPRLGRDDATYRAAIGLRVRSNVSQSTIADLFAIMALAWAGAWTLHETPYGSYRVQVRDIAAAIHGPLGDVLSRIRPLGHEGELVYSPLPSARTMRFANAGAPGVRPFNTGQAGFSSRFAHVRRL